MTERDGVRACSIEDITLRFYLDRRQVDQFRRDGDCYRERKRVIAASPALLRRQQQVVNDLPNHYARLRSPCPGVLLSTAKASLSKMQTAGRWLTCISKTSPCVVASRTG